MHSLPRWEELPTIELYLDQVLLYVNQHTLTDSKRDKGLTPAMINNYVKHGYLPKPIKKKYGQEHLARLIILSICKPVFAIADIIQVIQEMSQSEGAKESYNHFVSYYNEGAVHQIAPIIQKACQTIQAFHETLALIPSPQQEVDHV
ncbi:DUF1836 domain-containing protein [Streptococcus sp. DD13]|uniref:DUF1836 domain-containing protein n=1 Tax=Streptococcus sp. DD13 TaxID=1777881 RepID=UPI0007959D85|nr:DUF1836 domain-containing protein [Streptococcus sp. DD13]KXT78545.1 hypothetical protein STRDD13_00629 [Streptococcus sp. DD13]